MSAAQPGPTAAEPVPIPKPDEPYTTGPDDYPEYTRETLIAYGDARAAAAQSECKRATTVQGAHIQVEFQSYHDPNTFQQVFLVRWSVNGADCVTRVAVSSTLTFEEAVAQVRTDVARGIATVLLGDVFTSLKQSLRPW